MITFNLISVGSLKEKYWTDATKEYVKRLSAFAKINLIEIKESPLNNNASEAEIEKAKQIEAISLRTNAKGFKIALEVKGKSFSSEEFANKINDLAIKGVSEISFIIGGSNGLDKEFSKECNMQLSFSGFTFQNQIKKVNLLEQIYRAMCINNNKTYHKKGIEMNEEYMQIALNEALKANKKDEVPVGAIIVKNNKIISKAFNKRETSQNALLHAEIIAINKACKKLKSWRLEGCSLYVTLEPCPMCAGAIINSRIDEVYFGAYDAKSGSAGSVVNLFEVKELNHKPKVIGGIMQEACGQILTNFFKEKKQKVAKN